MPGVLVRAGRQPGAPRALSYCVQDTACQRAAGAVGTRTHARTAHNSTASPAQRCSWAGLAALLCAVLLLAGRSLLRAAGALLLAASDALHPACSRHRPRHKSLRMLLQACRNLAVNEQMKKLAPKGAGWWPSMTAGLGRCARLPFLPHCQS